MTIKITAIIVNYNTANEVGHCIDSLLKQRDVELEIIVVDNASSDSSLYVLKHYHDSIKLIESSENLGFGRANNLAFSQSTGDYIFLFNPDARLSDELGLSKLASYLKVHQQAGLVSPKIMDESGRRETLPCYVYPGQKHASQNFSHLPGKIAWVIGACMLIPRSVYQAIDGFDESFFLYGEDADLCLRIRQAGYQILHLEKVLVVHVGGASEKQAHSYDKTLRKQKALHHFYRQHYTAGDAIHLVSRELKRARRRLLGYQIKRLFGSRHQSRCEHYRAVYDSSKAFLGAIKK
ncbi:MAG: hypothetical protein CMF39_00930 [Legionellaceae bacterium]|nr:hypothetical protein [Legionellaceae bacterium]